MWPYVCTYTYLTPESTFMTNALETSLTIHGQRMFGVNTAPAERERERERKRER